MPDSKVCLVCKIKKPIKEFYKVGNSTYKNRPYYSSYCKPCHCKKSHSKRNGLSEAYKDSWARKRIRLDRDAVIAQMEEQNWACGLCGTDIDEKSFHYDHDHRTDQLREVLCPKCNMGLGLFDDDIELLELAIAYLKKHNKTEEESAGF